MGYYTSVHGEIGIDPSISWGEVRGSDFLPEADSDRAVLFRIEEEVIETDDGTLSQRRAVAVQPASDDSYKAYGIEGDLGDLLEQFGTGRTFTGRLEGFGEDNADMWRLYVVDGKARLEKPRIMWDDS